MLLLAGTLSIVLGAILVVATRVIVSHNFLSAGFRRLLGSEAASVALATLLGSGLVMILLFLADFDTNGLALLPGTLTMALGLGGVLAVRLLHKRYHLAGDEEDEAAPAVEGAVGAPDKRVA